PGLVTLGLLAVTVALFGLRHGRSRVRRDDLFLAAWWLSELAGAFVVAPWAAARRVLGPPVVGIPLRGRVAARTVRRPARRRLVGAVAGFSVILGLVVQAIDVDNAGAERDGVERATAWVRDVDPVGPIFFVGHWGLHFYAERAGWLPVDPDHTAVPGWS